MNETLQRDFDRVELAAEFPGQPALAYFELAAVNNETAQAVVDRVVALEGAGFTTDVEEVSQRTGLKLKRDVNGLSAVAITEEHS